MTEAKRAKTVAFTSARGGTGTTTVATNVAVALAHYSRAKTALLDLNVGRTITDQLLDLGTDGASVVDLLPVLGELAGEAPDESVLGQAEVSHATGLKVLVASRSADPVEVPEEAVVQLVAGLGARNDILVLDVPSSYDRTAFAALVEADRAIVVATPDVPTLKRTKALVQRIREAKGATQDGGKDGVETVRVVLNQANGSSELSLQQIEDFLGEPAWALIPVATAEARKLHDRRQIPVLDLSGPLGKAAYLTALKLHPMKKLAKPK
jgi:pilus assembly protein CpaE